MLLGIFSLVNTDLVKPNEWILLALNNIKLIINVIVFVFVHKENLAHNLLKEFN